MPGAAIGALLGAVFSSTIIGWGLAATWLGAVMIGASIGSLFDAQEIDLGSSTPNYAFGQLSNTKSQLLPVPIVYGRCRVGGNIFMQTFYDDSMQKMDMFVGVSEGPVQSIKSVYANDVVLIDENGDVVHELVDSSINLHLGAPDQVADSRDPGGNAYPNTAYIALTLKAQDGLSGNPVISSIVEGRKVWTPSGTVFTRNPAWIVYDFLTNTRYGVGIPTEYIDLASFTAAATYCDEVMDDDGPRFTLDYIIDVQRPAIDHLQAMLGCFRGYFLARDKIELHVEQTGSVYKALGPDNFVKDSFTWWQKSGDDSPNRIVIEWIDPNNHYEQSSAPFEIQEDIQARGVFEKSISLLGVTRPEQVGRLGNYLLETARRVQNFCAFQVSLQDADIEAGEIISITYPDFTGWSAKPFRVLKVQDEGQTGNVTITCAEYDAAVYSDDGLNVESPIQDSPPVTYDDVYALALEDVGHQEGDGTWVPVIRATWQNPSDYTPTAINVRWRYSGETDWNLSLNSTRLITQARIEGLKSGRTVEIWVNCVRPDTGKETTGKTASIIVGKDVVPPDAPTGLTATGWFGSIILEWINPTAPDLSHIEIWENAVDDRSSAVKIADAKGTTYMRYLGSFQGRYYWIRAVDLSGNVSAWNADAGVYGNSDQETHEDFVKELIRQNPVILEIIEDLNTEIERIDSIVDDVGNIVIDIGQLRDITVPAISAEIDEVRESELPAIVDGLKKEVQDSVDAAKNAADAVVRALIDLGDVGQILRDAGIQVDPADGKVKIWATEALRQEHQAILTDLSIQLDAQAGQIQQRATHAEVDERITQAVFGDVGELLLSGVDARINDVSSTLDALDASIEARALQIVSSPTGGALTDVKQRLSAAEGAIEQRATKMELDETADGVDVRLSMAESRIDAAEGSIGDLVIGLSREGVDPADITAEGLVNAILNGAGMLEDWQGELAIAKRELVAHTEEGISAEAAERVKLAAVVDSNYAEAQHELAVLATKQSVEATRTDSLLVRMGDAEGAILEEQRARVDADSAEASSRESLRAELQGEIDSDVSAAIDGIREVISDEVSALARQTTALVAQLGGDAGDALVGDVLGRAEGADLALRQYAAIQETMDVVVKENEEAVARIETTLGAAVGENYAAIKNEMETRATQDEALARVQQNLTAVVGQNTAAIQEESLARSTADEALAQRTTTLTAITLGSGSGDADVEEVGTLPAGPQPEGKIVFSTVFKKYFIWEPYSPGPGGYWREIDGVVGHSASKSAAAIETEEQARTTADSAMASQITTLESVVNNPSTGLGATRAALQTESTTRATADSALASNVSTLQTTVGGHTSSIQTMNTSINGIKSKHAVKIDTNGYVTGYELIGTGSSGSMVFHVDNFLVGRPGTTNQYPFVIGTVGGVTKVSMSNAFIQDAAISSAKIKTLAVGTLHIQDYAVTNTMYVERWPGSWETPADTNWSVNLVTRAVNAQSTDAVMVHAGGVFQFNSGSYDYHGGFVLRLYAGASGEHLIAEADYYKFVQKVGGAGGMPFLIAGMAPRMNGTTYLRLNAYCWGYNQNPPRVTRGSFEKCWAIVHQTRK